MSVLNIWVKILEWFQEKRSRTAVITGFNISAKEAFVNGDVPVILEASISKGYREYRHQFSNIISGSGFRIKAHSGMQLSKKNIVNIGEVVLANERLVRRLVVLGFDTLEVHCDVGNHGCRWQLHDYLMIGE